MKMVITVCDRCRKERTDDQRFFRVNSEDVCGDCLTERDALILAEDDLSGNYQGSSEGAVAARLVLERGRQ